ncbi:hypothetical protein Tco_1108813 [Tanacetum coccineum]
MQMVGGNRGNQFRQYARQNVRNLNGYNTVQNVRNPVVQNAVLNPAARADGNDNGNNGNQIWVILLGTAQSDQEKRDAAYLQTQLLIS